MPTKEIYTMSTQLSQSPIPQLESKPQLDATRPVFQTLLKKGTVCDKPLAPGDRKFTLVLDLDETLIHSEFVTDGRHSFTTTVKNESGEQTVYVYKRPYVDEFLAQVGQLFEVIIFTAGSEPYAKGVIDILDKNKVVSKRYYRDSCISYRNCCVKDLRILNIPLKNVAILDNSPISYCIQPMNGIPITTWINDPNDKELLNLIPFLKRASKAESFYSALEVSDFLDYGIVSGAKIRDKSDSCVLL